MPKGETRARGGSKFPVDPNRKYMRGVRAGRLGGASLKEEDRINRRDFKTKSVDFKDVRKTPSKSSTASSSSRRRPGGSSPKTSSASTGRRRPGK